MKKIIRLSAFTFVFLLFISANSFAQEQPDSGIDFYLAGKYERAVEVLLEEIKNDESNPRLWRYLGMSYARLKNEKEATKAFEKAAVLPADPEQVKAERIKLISNPIPGYTNEARKNNVQGEIKIAAEFNKNGQVSFIYPFKKLPHGMTERGVEAVRKIKFEPAETDGQPITTIGILVYRFTLY